MQKRLIYIALLFIGFTLCFSFASAQCRGVDGDITWERSNEGILTLSGIGKMKHYTHTYGNGRDDTNAPWAYDSDKWPNSDMYVSDSIVSVEIIAGITNIGTRAFYNFHNLSSVSIPNSVISLGNYVFYNCQSLTSITIPNSVTELGINVFKDCSELISISFSSNITNINNGTFYGCTNLANFVIQDNVTNIGNRAFQDCKSIKSINIPTSITTIGNNVFNGCINLTDVYFEGDAPSDISENAFQGASFTAHYPAKNETYTDEYKQDYGGSISWVATVDGGTCGDNIKWIIDENDMLTISGTGNMNDYRDPIDINSVGEEVPWGYENIKAISISDGIEYIGNSAFAQTQITELTIPDSVKRIGFSAFRDCEDLKRINIPNGVTIIPANIFNGCCNLKSITIPENVIRIEKNAFSGCSIIDNIIIPMSVTLISEKAFSGCVGLKNIYLSGNIPYFSQNCFYNTSAIIHYPYDNETYTEEVMQDYGGNIVWEKKPIQSGNCGKNAKWELSVDGILKICGTGNMQGYPAGATPWYAYREAILSIVVEDGITRISNNAFRSFPNLQSVELPNTLNSIGDRAFMEDRELETIVLPDSIFGIGAKAFMSCSKLKSITIPRNVKWLAPTDNDSSTNHGDLFYGCSSLSNVYFEGDIPNINESAFRGASFIAHYPLGNKTYTHKSKQQYEGNVVWVTNPEHEHLPSQTFIENMVNPTCAIEGGYDFVKYCTICDDELSREHIVLAKEPHELNILMQAISPTDTTPGRSEEQKCLVCNTVIGGNTIPPLNELNVLYLPNGIRNINYEAFMGDAFQAVIVPDTCIFISIRAFAKCKNLLYVRIPQNLAQIADNAFKDCDNLIMIDRK